MFSSRSMVNVFFKTTRKMLMILLGKSKSKTLKKIEGKRNNNYISTTENSQLCRGVVRTNQTSKMELFAKIVNG